MLERERCVREQGRSFMGRVRTVCRRGRSLIEKSEKCVRERGRSFIGRVRTVCRRERSLLERERSV